MKHLTSISELTVIDIEQILDLAHYYQKNFKQKHFTKILENKIVANIFYENSTRTRFSFEVAQKALGAQVLNFDKNSSSVAKGESLYDTLKTFESLQIDLAVIRHSDDHFIDEIKNKLNYPIINAGAGKFEHPSQTLLDLLTLKNEFKTLNNLTVGICGDVVSSRVAKSFIHAAKILGINILVCGPSELLPQTKELPSHVSIATIDESIGAVDAMMFLRVQHERHETFELSTNKYNEQYGLNHERIQKLKKNAIIMHPGPINRNVEILSDLVEHKNSRIFAQMENGVYTRMAILNWIFTEGKK